MMYSGVLLQLDLPHDKLVARIGPILDLQFERGPSGTYYAMRRSRRFEVRTTDWSDDPEWTSYSVEIEVSGHSDSTRLRVARDIFRRLRALGVPMALVDFDTLIVDRYVPTDRTYEYGRVFNKPHDEPRASIRQ